VIPYCKERYRPNFGYLIKKLAAKIYGGSKEFSEN